MKQQEVIFPYFKYETIQGEIKVGKFIEMDNGTLIYEDEVGKECAMMYEL